jgi:hypothetical protein
MVDLGGESGVDDRDHWLKLKLSQGFLEQLRELVESETQLSEKYCATPSLAVCPFANNHGVL